MAAITHAEPLDGEAMDASPEPYILVSAVNADELARKLRAAFLRGYTPKLQSSSMVDTAARRIDVLCEHVNIGHPVIRGCEGGGF